MKLTIGATVRFVENDATKANAMVRACGFETDGTVIAINADGTRADVEVISASYSGMFRGVEVVSLRVVAEAPAGFTIDEYATRSAVVSARALRDYHDGTPTDVKSSRARIASLRTNVRFAREALRDYYMDCSPCGSVIVETCPLCWTPVEIGCDCGEVVEPAEAAAEQQAIADLTDVMSEQLAIALTGWDGSDHTVMRNFCGSVVNDCMWRIDRLLMFADFWYPDMTFGMPADVATEQVRKYVTWATDPANRAAFETRIGAEISTKNRSKIQGMADRVTAIADECQKMLSASDAVTGDEPADPARSTPSGTIRVISGSPSSGRGDGAGLIRVSASGNTAAGADDEPTSRHQHGSLYGSDVLRLKQ